MKVLAEARTHTQHRFGVLPRLDKTSSDQEQSFPPGPTEHDGEALDCTALWAL